MALLNTNIGPERVQVFPQPLGTLQVPGAGISTAAFLISTSLMGAQKNTAVKVTSLDEFVTAFGGPDEVANGAYYSVKGYFDNAGTGNTAYIVNCGTAPTVADYIGDAATGTGLRALDAIDEVGLVMIPGLPLAQAYLVQKALIDYTETVRAEFGATLSTSFSLIEMPKEINRADTDTLLITGQLQVITGTGPWVLDIELASAAVAATGTITIVAFASLSGATVTIAGHVLTEGSEWTAATSNNATATSLATAIAALTEVNATALGAVITITAATAGLAGNSITIAASDLVNLTRSGPTLTGGLDGDLNLSSVKPGMIVRNHALTYTGIISAVDNTTDTVTVTPDPSTFFMTGDDVLIELPSAVTYKEIVVNNASKTVGWWFNPGVVVDESSTAQPGDLVIVDSIGHVAGMMSRIDANIQIGGPSHAPAGQQYAQLAGLSGLALSISERRDGAPLRLNFINRIQTFPGVGIVSFGGYTGDSGTLPTFTAEEQLIQVIRTLQFIKASLEPGLRAFIWENFSPETQGRVVAAIESFLRNNSYLFPSGLAENRQFKVISVEPTQDELNQGLLRVRVQVRPNQAVRFIEVALEFPLPIA